MASRRRNESFHEEKDYQSLQDFQPLQRFLRRLQRKFRLVFRRSSNV